MFGIDEDAEGANQPSCNATLVHEMKIECMCSEIQHLQKILDHIFFPARQQVSVLAPNIMTECLQPDEKGKRNRKSQFSSLV